METDLAQDLSTYPAVGREGLTIISRTQLLVGGIVDVLGQIVNGSITQEKIGSAGMIRFETSRTLPIAVVIAVVLVVQDALLSAGVEVDRRRRGCPLAVGVVPATAMVIVTARQDFPTGDDVRGTVRDVGKFG